MMIPSEIRRSKPSGRPMPNPTAVTLGPVSSAVAVVVTIVVGAVDIELRVSLLTNVAVGSEKLTAFGAPGS